jgi:N-acetylmuramoyl-L-alanine amidase
MPWSRCGLAALVLIAGLATGTELSLETSAQQAPPPAPKPALSAPRPQTATPGQSPSSSPVATPAPPPPPAPPRFVIVIDAAHGGDDLGGHLSSGQLEKNANLTLSVRLRSALGARGIQVITTRESDQSVAMVRRAEIANHADAKACISLHTADTGSGVHLFVSSLAPASTTRFVAWKTAQAASIVRSLALAGVLNSALLHAGTTVTLGRTPLPGIESMTCPAVAIEVAPERDSDHKVTAEPDDANYQARIAQTLATALLEWRTDAWRPDASRLEGRQP